MNPTPSTTVTFINGSGIEIPLGNVLEIKTSGGSTPRSRAKSATGFNTLTLPVADAEADDGKPLTWLALHKAAYPEHFICTGPASLTEAL